MSAGIIQSALRTGSGLSELEIYEPSKYHRDIPSEQPTLADLVLPGTGRPISNELSCFLDLLATSGERA